MAEESKGWFSSIVEATNETVRDGLDATVGRPDFLKEAPTPGEAIEKVQDAANLAQNAFSDTPKVDERLTKALPTTAEGRAAEMARINRSNENIEQTVAAVQTAAQSDVGQYIEGKLTGLEELATEGPSKRAVQEFKETRERVDSAMKNPDKEQGDRALMGEMRQQAGNRVKTLEDKLKGMGAEDEGRESVENQVADLKKLQNAKNPDRPLTDTERKEIAGTTKGMAGQECSAKLSKIDGKASEVAANIEDAMITSVQVAANIVAPGAGGLAVGQAVGVADQMGGLGGEKRHGEAVAKLATGNVGELTLGNVLKDGVEIAASIIPGGGQAAKQVAQAAEQQIAKQIAKEVGNQAVDLVKDKALGAAKDFVAEKTDELVEKATGSKTISGAVENLANKAEKAGEALGEKAIKTMETAKAAMDGKPDFAAMLKGQNLDGFKMMDKTVQTGGAPPKEAQATLPAEQRGAGAGASIV